MFFKKTQAVPELLQKKNIIVNCEAQEKDQVIRQVGHMLVDSGYVQEDYVDAMLKREETFATNMGNGIALPHGVEEAKKAVKHSGIAVMVFPNGTDWNGEMVKLVIGIAGKGDDHLLILSNIAERLCEEEAVNALAMQNVDEVYEVLTRKDAE